MNHTKMTPEEWIRRANFSEESRPKAQSITRWARRGRIEASKVGGKWFVHVDQDGNLIDKPSPLSDKWLSIL